MENAEEKLKELKSLAVPLAKWLKSNGCPHDKVIITDSHVSFLKGEMGAPISSRDLIEYIKESRGEVAERVTNKYFIKYKAIDNIDIKAGAWTYYDEMLDLKADFTLSEIRDMIQNKNLAVHGSIDIISISKIKYKSGV